jgi:hypothetical protein
LEQLDDVARGVLEKDLGAAGSGEDVVAEGEPITAEARDLGLDVVDDEVDAVPAAGAGPVPRRAWGVPRSWPGR